MGSLDMGSGRGFGQTPLPQPLLPVHFTLCKVDVYKRKVDDIGCLGGMMEIGGWRGKGGRGKEGLS